VVVHDCDQSEERVFKTKRSRFIGSDGVNELKIHILFVTVGGVSVIGVCAFVRRD
jgi:hypothetical protein